MGVIRMGVPVELVLKLKNEYNLQGFIETGTYYGETALWAAQNFEKVITIELSKEIYEEVYKQYGHFKNIEFLFGDTREKLRLIIPQLKEPCLFWLDAHWSGGKTYGVNDECPLIEELEIINSAPIPHLILIDDARLFLTPPPPPHQQENWPDIGTVLDYLNNPVCRYTFIYEDVIVAIPESVKTSVNKQTDISLGKQARKENRERRKLPKQNYNRDIEIGGEIKIINKLVAAGNVVFDVGANTGQWTNQILQQQPNVQVHLFEPVLQIYETLLGNLATEIQNGKIIPNNCEVTDREGNRQFYYYENDSLLSTSYRRIQAENQINLATPKEFSVVKTTLNKYCDRLNIKQIDFLKIDVEGSELEVLQGANNLLKQGKINYIQFEYGDTFLDAKVTLEQMFTYLNQFNYTIFKILPNGLEHRPNFNKKYENFQKSSFLAVNERSRSSILGEKPKMLDLKALCEQHWICPRGVIHIGAHEGQEIELYKAMGVQKILFIEANPVVFERLKQKIAGLPNVQAINCAISNENSTVTLHLTSLDLSSSILPLKYHQEIYPEITEIGQINVQAKTLDTLLQELQLDRSEFNILNIDIQGAELLAFQGATNTLKYIEAINTEVNYQELYAGSGLIDEVDRFLNLYGFDRVATTTPYHPSWGDAFYVKPVITMSTLGQNGRFGNQIFQYAFLKIYAQQHNLRVQIPNWIGEYLFGHKDPVIYKQLPLVPDSSNNYEESSILNAKKIFKNIDFWGYFQYNTIYYAPHKDYFRSLFQPAPEVLNKITVAIENLRSKGKTIVGLHLRRGDFGYGPYFVAPSEWYKEWLSSLWPTLDRPVLFIASDEIEKVLIDFAEYNPIASKDLNINLPQADFYLDFYILSQCDIVAISNSSFSFAACMLNDKGNLFYRPQLETQNLISFDPWNSKPVFEDKRFIPIKTDLLLNTDAILEYIKEYQEQPNNQSSIGNVRQLRLQLANYLFGISAEEIQNVYLGEIGKTHQIMLDSNIRNEALNDTEQIVVNNLLGCVAKGLDDPKAINYLLAAMLYCRADQLTLDDKIDAVPNWFLTEYLKFIFFSPRYFQEVGKVDSYYKHIERWLNVLHTNLFSKNNQNCWQNIALFFIKNSDFIPLYFTSENLKDIYKKRGDIIEFTLRISGHKIDYNFSDRPVERQKIRLGILNSHFLPQTETFTTIPVFEYLNKQQYEIILYTINITEHPLEKYCQSCADRMVKLPNDLASQVQTIRADDLDILLIGTNVTAVTNPITLLAVHRLARVQLTSVSSPVTTGIRNIDYYISGNLTEPIPDNQLQYTEKLVGIDGSAHCFNYKVEPEIVTIKCDKKSLGIPEESIVFISGANFYKIIPELRETWAKIIASVPNSVLILYPFGLAWSNSYQGMPFLKKMRAIFAKYNIQGNRLFILNPLPSRADVKECLKLGDVYLDSYPYSGANSTIDPLEVGLPTVIMDGICFGNSFRSRQASALLRDLEIVDLIADSEESYIKLAINLANDLEFRQQKREQIRQEMQSNPRFLDSRFYSAQIGALFQNIFQEWQKSNAEKLTNSTNESIPNHLLEQSVDSLKFLNFLSGCLNLYEIDPFDESVLAELRLLRQRLADFWLSAVPEELENHYSGNPGKAHQMLLNSEFKQENLTESEQTFVDNLLANLTQGYDDRNVITYRLSAMLYGAAKQWGDSSHLPN